MSQTVQCLNPMVHRVEVHIAGSAAARECASMSGKSPRPVVGAGSAPKPSVTAPRMQRELSTAISNYDLYLSKYEGSYVLTGDFQVTASNEDDALEIAESSFWEQDGQSDFGVSVTRISDNQWNVVTQFLVEGRTFISARENAVNQFIGDNPKINLS